MKINDLVVKESKIYYLEQMHLDHQYLEEGIGSAIGAGLGKAANFVGKGVGGVVGGAVGMGKQIAKGFGSGYHGAQSAVTGQPSAPRGQAAPRRFGHNVNMTYQGMPVNTSGLSSYNPATATMPGGTASSYQQVASQIAKLSPQEKQQLVSVLQKELTTQPAATATPPEQPQQPEAPAAPAAPAAAPAAAPTAGTTATGVNYSSNFQPAANPLGINATNWINPKSSQVTMNPNLQGRRNR